MYVPLYYYTYVYYSQEFHLNSYVISESLCVGEIYGISYKVTLKSEDGSIFTIDNPNINHFIHKKTNNVS